MQVQADHETMSAHVHAASSPRKRKSAATRKVTVRLTEEIFEQLQAVTQRPGVGKSMVVQAALAHFLNASGEPADARHLDGVHARFEGLERELRLIAETVALHARYHFAVMPPLPPSQQREAVLLGDERFKILAEQVDRRVRLSRPLMQETIDSLKMPDRGPESESNGDHVASMSAEPNAARDGVANLKPPFAAAGEGGSNSYFRDHATASCRTARPG
jgi:hypothetical protein